LKTEKEREIGIGDAYPHKPIPFGECWMSKDWAFNGELEIFSFLFDFTYLANHYNRVAAEKGGEWEIIKDTKKLLGLKTRFPCLNRGILPDDLAMKVTKHRPDTFIMEYDHFLKHLSYYLPDSSLRDNKHFVQWLRNTEGLSD